MNHMNCKIKICGISNPEDLALVARAGADYGGLLIDIPSVRASRLEDAVEKFKNPPLPIVAVTLDKTVEENLQTVQSLSPAALQMHGYETPEMVQTIKQRVECDVWKVIHLPAGEKEEQSDIEAFVREMKLYIQAGADSLVVDAMCIQQGEKQLGGTGQTVDWQAARELCQRANHPVYLAGGINPNNVFEAVTRVQPYGIDLSSGVELTKGKKDPDKVLQLISAVRSLERPDGGRNVVT